jgi:structure-specific recognition protein 1
VPGALKLSTQGVQWRPTSETSSGMTLAPDKVLHAQLTTLSGSATLSLVTAQKSHLWTGLKSSDVATVQRILSGYPSLPTLVESTQAVGGGNWGRVAVDAGRLSFLPPGDDDAKTTLQVNVTDATDVQLVGKHDLMMHFPVDGQDAEDLPMDHDALVEMSFYVPPGATAATMGVPPAPVEDEDAPPPHPGQALLERLREVADVDAVASGDAIATFEDVSMLIPRGKFDLEIFGSSLKLSGQNQDFSVRFSAMVRLFVLPKQGTPQTMVVISLDPPIRKGNTFYPHLVCQFPSVQESEISLEMTDADFAERQKAAGGRLEKAYQGPTYDVFSKVRSRCRS